MKLTALLLAAAIESISAQYVAQPICLVPADTTGYSGHWVSNLYRASFEVTGITCATGFTGVPVAAVCASGGTEYTLSGCSDGGLPKQVDGSKIYFSNVKDSSITINWRAPDLGDYAAQILGYNIEISEVCANSDYADLDISTGGALYNIHDFEAGNDPHHTSTTRTITTGSRTTALALGSSSIGNDGTTTATYGVASQTPFVGPRTWTMNYDAAGGTPDYRPHTASPSAALTGTATFESVAADNTATPIFTSTYPSGSADTAIDLRTGVTLDQASCSGTNWAAGEPIAATSVGTGTNAWTPLVGVYTPMGGQDHSKKCRAECAPVDSAGVAVAPTLTSTCADVAADNTIRDALFSASAVSAGVTAEEEIIEACGGCFPDATTASGCFPGSTGFPTGPHYSCASRSSSTGLCDCAAGACVSRHTVSGLHAGAHYIVRVTAFNHFGTGVASSSSYAVKMTSAPTKPLEVETVLTGTTAIALEWKAPNNFDTGTIDCASGGHTNSDAAGAATAAKLACSMKPVAEILAECDGETTVGFVDSTTVDGTMTAAESAACFGATKKYDCATSGSGDDLTPVAYACTTVGTGASIDITKYTVYQTDSGGSSPVELGTLDPAVTAADSNGDYNFAISAVAPVAVTGTTPVPGTEYFFRVSASRPTTAIVGGFMEGAKSDVTAITMPAVPLQLRGLGPKGMSITLPPSPAAVTTTTLPVYVTGTASTASACTIDLDFIKAEAKAVLAGRDPAGIDGYQIMGQSCSKATPTATTCTWGPAARYSLSDDISSSYQTQTSHGSTVGADIDEVTVPAGVLAASASVERGLVFQTPCVFEAGDGGSHNELNVGTATSALACMKLVQQLQPTANGVTWDNTGSGDCFAEFEMTGVLAGSYLTCALNSMGYLNPAHTFTTTVSDLAYDTEYRFFIRFHNAAGYGAYGDPSPSIKTLEKPIDNLKIYSGPPCVLLDPDLTGATATEDDDGKTTFAASATGSNIEYRWELVFRETSGASALNHDSAAGNNDFDAAGAQTGRTTGVMSMSTIAMPGNSACGNPSCSVMRYALPLPGFDESVANYDEMEIRVVAYNKRGMRRNSVSFGWNHATGHDYQTIEYCGCTEPTDPNYWDLATYHLPDACYEKETFNKEASQTGTFLNTIIEEEYEYYQFTYDDSAYEVEVTIRVDTGSVDVYLSTEGIANPILAATYSMSETDVSTYKVVTVPYTHLAGSNHLYITVKGRHLTDGSDEFSFATYKIMAQKAGFRSMACTVAEASWSGSGENGCDQATVERTLLNDMVAVTAQTVPTYYYQFFEYYYPRADNDIDVELIVTCTTGQVELFASMTERYPSPERATATYAGFWTGTSHTGEIAASTTPTSFFYTLSPEDHRTTNVLYVAVKGDVAHTAGSYLPSSTYDITAKVYRYRVESNLLDLSTGFVEDRRYSVVTLDNFNYYELKLTPATYEVTFDILVHYGSVSVYTSKSTLPTQDVNIGHGATTTDGSQTGRINVDSTSTTATSITIPVAELNLVDGYVYVGIIGRVTDSSYDISVTLNQVNGGAAPTKIYNCVTFVGTTADCDSGHALGNLLVGTYYYAYHISDNANVDMSITQRSGAGSPVADVSGQVPSTDPNTWGTDWTETSIDTWVDDFTDEWNFDVDLKITLPAAGSIYASATDPYPSAERGTAQVAVSAATETAVLPNVATFSKTWVYVTLVIPGSSGAYTSAIVITPEESQQGASAGVSTDPVIGAHACPTGGAPASECSQHGSCIIMDATATCFCDEGYSGAACDTPVTPGLTTFAHAAVVDLSLSTTYTTAVGASGDFDRQCTDLLEGGSAWVDTSSNDCATHAATLCTDATGEAATASHMLHQYISVGGMGIREACCACGGGTHKFLEVAGFAAAASRSIAVKSNDLYTAAVENHQLDCSIDDCTPRGTAGTLGYVACAAPAAADTACTMVVPAPMMTITSNLVNVPAYSKVITYIDGKPYPRVGANSYTVAAAVAVVQASLKVYGLSPGQTHTAVVVLTTDKGKTLSIDQRSFSVDYMGGCDSTAASACSSQGVCHLGFCVCFDGFYGSDCAGVIDRTATSPTITATEGGATAYRMRRDALVYEKLAESRFVNKMMLEETATAVTRSNAALSTIKQTVLNKLDAQIYDGSSAHKTTIANAKSTIASEVEALYLKKERNTIRVQQAKQESARLKTANLEAYLDHKRSLYAHQTEVQNDLAAAKKVVEDKIAAKTAVIAEAFMEGRFIKNQLRTMNGPRTAVSDLKTQECTTDQFFGTKCTDVDYDDDQFARTTDTVNIDTLQTTETGTPVSRGL